MNGTNIRRAARIAVAAGVIGLFASGAMAQSLGGSRGQSPPAGNTAAAGAQQTTSTGAGSLRPPSPNKAESPKLWLYYLILLVLTGATVGVSIMPSKRSHRN